MENSKDVLDLLKKIGLILIVGVIFCAVTYADSTYIVKKGDTLYSISRKYEITVAELRAANNLGENDVLKEGAKLVIPSADISNAAALSSSKSAVQSEKSNSDSSSAKTTVKTTTYTVEKGDTLYGIARKNNMKLPELLSLNNIDTSATIKVGQKLLVPDTGNTGKPTTVANTSSASRTATVSKTDKTDDKKSTTEVANVKKSEMSSAEKYIATGSVVWPLENPTVKNIKGKVSGVQLTGKTDESVRTVREGTVMYTGVYRGFGEIVFVQSKTGLIYSYSGLGKVTAKKGDYVVSGDEIGKTGRGDDSSIKFMVFQNGMPIDPAKAPRG